MTSPAPADPNPTPQQPATPPSSDPTTTVTSTTGSPGPATVTVPQFVAPIPAQQQNPPAAPATPPQEPDGFPANTPLTQMTESQQAAYWKAQARKHEDRVKAMGDYEKYKTAFDEYERLLTASQTEQEKAVAEARRQGHAEALAAAGGQLVEQWVRAAAAGRLAEQSVDALLSGLDRSRFLRTDGGVDTDKVYQFVGSITPSPAPAVQPAAVAPVPAPATPPVVTPTGGPDFGQGTPGSSRPSGINAGRELARQQFAAQHQSTAATPA